VRGAVTVTAVDLDATATKGDQPVDDLRADEIVLEIDGKPVPLDYFTPVVAHRLTGPARPGAGADPAGLVARNLMLLIDEDHLVPQDRPRVFEAARAFLAGLDPSDRFAVAVLQQGRIRSLVPFGTAIEIAGSALDRQQKDRYSLGALGRLAFAAPTARERERHAFRQVRRAIQSLGALPGRKEMVVISRGLNRHEGIEDRDSFGGLEAEVDDLVRQANRSRVTVHTLGVGGLQGGSGFC
jgi:VWFA-related protein